LFGAFESAHQIAREEKEGKCQIGDHSMMVVVFLVETIYPFVCGAEWRFWRYIWH
jgi:hypothetical protein